MAQTIDLTSEDRDIAGHFKEHGFAGLQAFLQKKLDAWRGVPVNVGLIGDSGCGRSSFINAIRDLCDDDEGAAPVGVVETTTEPYAYNFPNNKNLKLWDLPGVGTGNFPKETYLKDIKFQDYDFFIIMTAGRFRENDIWFGEEIEKEQKTFYYVRTKMDQDVVNANANKRNKRDDDEIASEIRADCTAKLQARFSRVPVFLISSHKKALFDFHKLVERMVSDAPDLKKEALVLSLRIVTKNLIVEKQKYLTNRMWKLAAVSASVSICPIPGVSIFADIAVLVNEVEFYKEQFGFSDETRTKIERDLGLSHGQLFAVLDVASNAAVGEIGKIIVNILKSQCLKEDMPRFTELVGPTLAVSVSFGTTYFTLTTCLKDIVDAGENLLDLIKQKVRKRRPVQH